MKSVSLAKSLTAIALLSVSLNSMACNFSLKGNFQCYKAMDKKEETILLGVDAISIDHFVEGVEIRKKKKNETEFKRLYTLGKNSKAFGEADRSAMISTAEWYLESITDFYEKEVTCAPKEINITRKYFYAEPDYFGTDGISEEQIKTISGSHIEYTYKMTDIELDGPNKHVVVDEKHYCFWK